MRCPPGTRLHSASDGTHHTRIPPSYSTPARALEETLQFWEEWCDGIQLVHGEWEDLALRSLITLKGLTYGPTGGIVAAPTTSLPESLGGVRNWDYRYCWVRDAALTLDALIDSGLRDEAEGWLRWLGRVAAGDPEQLQIMYGPGGERRLTELEVDWLPGYGGSAPVRIGNAAFGQFQLDVYGELMDAVERARTHGIAVHKVIWRIQTAIMRFLVDHWSDPDDGIWEVRGPRRLFTHSKVMTWVAFDRAVRGVEVHGLDGPADEWHAVCEAIHAEVSDRGWNEQVGAFTQSYGSAELDASLLMMPLVGFLPADDERVVRTVEAIQEHLMHDGFVLRYENDSGVDGLPGGEGMFLPCTLWLVDCLVLMGRLEEATVIFRRIAALGQRCWAHLRGVRPNRAALARKLSASPHSRRDRQLGSRSSCRQGWRRSLRSRRPVKTTRRPTSVKAWAIDLRSANGALSRASAVAQRKTVPYELFLETARRGGSTAVTERRLFRSGE